MIASETDKTQSHDQLDSLTRKCDSIMRQLENEKCERLDFENEVKSKILIGKDDFQRLIAFRDQAEKISFKE